MFWPVALATTGIQGFFGAVLRANLSGKFWEFLRPLLERGGWPAFVQST